jgi:UDP-2,3-diacylglucosamine hydrolase
VADYFTSDVHLRLDCPDRGRRFAHWVNRLEPTDSLTVVGDLCDFWLVSRQFPLEVSACPGLKCLADFRARGQSLTIMTGNHDHWLGEFYAERLAARVIPEDTVERTVSGLRLHIAHGHRMRSPSRWKGLMEQRAFLEAFRKLPHAVAAGLEWMLDSTNELRREKSESRQIADYRRFADTLTGKVDLVIFGHVHRTHDDEPATPRLIVLGDWFQGSSYLRIDDTGAQFVVESGLTEGSQALARESRVDAR